MEKKSFDYTYSAEAHEEIVAIQKKYGIDQAEISDQEAMLQELRRLDRSTTRSGTIAGLTVGVIGTLIMGTGMSMAMVWNDRWFIEGIIVGILGIAVVAVAYPVYKKIVKKRKEKNLPRIQELSSKLLGEDQ